MSSIGRAIAPIHPAKSSQSSWIELHDKQWHPLFQNDMIETAGQRYGKVVVDSRTCMPLDTPGVPGGGRLSPLPRPGMKGPRPLPPHQMLRYRPWMTWEAAIAMQHMPHAHGAVCLANLMKTCLWCSCTMHVDRS